MLLGGVEAGGTKMICGVAHAPDAPLETVSIPTRGPDETAGAILDYFKSAEARFGAVSRLGVASFGPLNLDRASPGYGALLKTPKPGWSGFNLSRTLWEGLGCDGAVETDVAGAGLAEQAYGAGRGRRSVGYITVGTGIGGALIVDGRPQWGRFHSEMGHVPVRRRPEDADFRGVCPFHDGCAEGLASGPAAKARLGFDLAEAAPDAGVWDLVTDYVAQLCYAVMLTAAPERLILGGGVMSRPETIDGVRAALLRLNNGYIEGLATAAAVTDVVRGPELDGRAGLIGALQLAAATAPRALL